MKVRFLCAVYGLAAMLAILTLIPPPALAASGFSDDADAVENAANSVFMLEVYGANSRKIATGSGFVAFDSSTLVTNYHVVEGGAYVVALGDDAEQYVIDSACIVDRQLDLAILHFSKPVTAAPLPLQAEDQLKRSQRVVAIGSPAGLKNTVSIGNISGFYNQNGKNWIQFTAPISSGSSGGALLSDDGKVVGITTASYASTQNVNLAIRSTSLIALYKRWDGKTFKSLGAVTGGGAASAVSVSTETVSGKVWVTNGGKKYHSSPTCSKMKNPVEMDLMEAIQNGYEPCGKCFK